MFSSFLFYNHAALVVDFVCRFVDTSGPMCRSMTGALRCSMTVNMAGRVLTTYCAFHCKLLLRSLSCSSSLLKCRLKRCFAVDIFLMAVWWSCSLSHWSAQCHVPTKVWYILTSSLTQFTLLELISEHCQQTTVTWLCHARALCVLLRRVSVYRHQLAEQSSI